MAIIRAPTKFEVSYDRVGNAEPVYIVRDDDLTIAIGSRAVDARKLLIANGMDQSDAQQLVSEARKWGTATKWVEV